MNRDGDVKSKSSLEFLNWIKFKEIFTHFISLQYGRVMTKVNFVCVLFLRIVCLADHGTAALRIISTVLMNLGRI